jgi:hypothetical protein
MFQSSEINEDPERRSPQSAGPSTPDHKIDDLAAESIARANSVPEQVMNNTPAADFGAQGGQCISNKMTILSDLDKFLGRNAPPSLEYIFVEPLANVRLPDGRGSGMNPFGHAVVRYTLPGGEQRVMNISGLAGHDMVNFMDPAEYLYGTDFAPGNEQKGLYNRSMIGLRIEEVSPEKILKLDEYYCGIRERQRNGDAKFHLSMSRLVNTLDWMLPMAMVEMGNCAAWSSAGLKNSGITNWRSYYPKRIFVKLLQETARHEPADNWNVVSYQRIPHAVRAVGIGDEIRGPVTPIHFFSSRKYRDLHDMSFVKATVLVPEGETTAVIRPGGWKAQNLGH